MQLSNPLLLFVRQLYLVSLLAGGQAETARKNIPGVIKSNATFVFAKSSSLDAQLIVQLPLPSSVTSPKNWDTAVIKAEHWLLRFGDNGTTGTLAWGQRQGFATV